MLLVLPLKVSCGEVHIQILRYCFNESRPWVSQYGIIYVMMNYLLCFFTLLKEIRKDDQTLKNNCISTASGKDNELKLVKISFKSCDIRIRLGTRNMMNC